MDLYNNILYLLEIRNLTVCEILERISPDCGDCDDWDISKIIGKLEIENKIELKGFKIIYREDGGCIHLALYGKKR